MYPPAKQITNKGGAMAGQHQDAASLVCYLRKNHDRTQQSDRRTCCSCDKQGLRRGAS
jgi:hypothetical protein